MLNQVGASKADTIVKLVLIFFVSLLSFSVGTFVGKQVSDSDYKRAALEEDYKSFRQANHSRDQKASHDEKVSDEELRNLTEEFVNKEKVAMKKDDNYRDMALTKQGKEKNKAHVELSKEHSGYKKYTKNKLNEEFFESNEVKKEQQLAATYRDKFKKLTEKLFPEKKHKPSKKMIKADKGVNPVTKEAVRVATGKAPMKNPKKVRKPTSILPPVATSSIGKYTVQVASYANKEEAKAHALELKQKGWSAFYIPAEVRGRTWFRVSVGLFTNQKSATNFRKELMGNSSVSSAIIQKITQ